MRISNWQILAPILLFVLLFSMLCYAQKPSGASPAEAEVDRKIELQIRSFYSVPPKVSVAIGKRSPSDVPGYDKQDVTLSLGDNRKELQFLISKDNTNMVRWEKIDLNANPMNSIDLNGRPWRGGKDAKVVIVNYDDFECPFCARMHQTLFPGILKEYGDRVKIIYKDYPLTEIHPWALHAAVDANCLVAQNGAQGNEAYWEFADYAHTNQKELDGDRASVESSFKKIDKLTEDLGKKHNLNAAQLQACVKQQAVTGVRSSMQEGEKLGVEATPTLFINGERVAGALPEDELRAVIDRALVESGEKAPESKPSASQ